MQDQVRQQIFSLIDPDYQKFSAKLNPTASNILGVRLPHLRKLAKQIAKDDWRRYLATAKDDYFEEVMLQGLVIGSIKADIEEILLEAAKFIPKINNWSVCDSFCSSLKVTNKYKERVWEFIQPYIASDQEYDLRFAVVMMLNYYLDREYIDHVLLILDRIKHEAYYVKMAIAWAISMCFIKYPDQTIVFLKDNTLDDFTYHKALQKITESHRVDQETKMQIRQMRRK